MPYVETVESRNMNREDNLYFVSSGKNSELFRVRERAVV